MITIGQQIDALIALDNLTIEFGALRPEYSPNGYPRWVGKVAITLDSTTVTANWVAADDFSREGTLVDFEGDADESDPVYAECEARANEIAAAITARLPNPSSFDAHSNDLERMQAA